MLTSIKKIYKTLAPERFRKFVRRIFNSSMIYTSSFRNNILLQKAKGKSNYNVAIFMKLWDGWKLESLYKSLDKHTRFSPIIVICPFMYKGQEFLHKELEKNIEQCKSKSYNYFIAYDNNKKKVIDIKKILQPDIVLFDGPNNHSSNKLYIYHFWDTLTCNFPYAFRNSQFYEYDYNNSVANLSWINFYETEIHKELAQSHAKNKGKNVVALGYPFFDYKLEQKKPQIQKDRKIIIWAPHWTIEGYQDTPLNWSCFLIYNEFMLYLAEKYCKEIEFILKPHPLLESILNKDELWGAVKTKSYFNKWTDQENCSIKRGDYKDLFLNSDAMIHDCGSFTTEYLIENKPVAYTVSNAPIENRFSKYGEIILEGHLFIRSKIELENFVVDVINGIDPLKNKREQIISRFNFNKQESAADKIVEYIDNLLK